VSAESARHDKDGTPHGEFAAYIDQCRQWHGLAPTSETKIFHSVKYVNASPNRLFPLMNCRIEGDDIRGQFFWMTWTNCVLTKIDLSHTGGVAHWTRVQFENVNFHHLMAKVSAAQTVFRACNFNNIVLEQPVFLQCKFVKCKISGALIGAMFIDCEFEDVDLKGSRWEDPKTLDIRGTWKNAEQMWETSSPKAKAFFLRKPIEAVST